MNMESIYGLTFDQLAAWLLERGHKISSYAGLGLALSEADYRILRNARCK